MEFLWLQEQTPATASWNGIHRWNLLGCRSKLLQRHLGGDFTYGISLVAGANSCNSILEETSPMEFLWLQEQTPATAEFT